MAKLRAAAIGEKPWYVGEMGWCRSQSPENRSPYLPQHCRSQHLSAVDRTGFWFGCAGCFLWGLDGLQHREFYGLSTQVMAIYPRL